ncbi:G patch domain-containing protein 4 [Lissotriton helveticus]
MSGHQGSMSKGMKFAEQLMQNQGWKEGHGLGKKENGISQAIKVKIKSGKAGIGHNAAEQFTFHWWDHIFNKTASSYDVQTEKDGVQMKRLTEKDMEITNKKPLKSHGNPNLLYGRFIKSATLLSGGEEPVEKPSSSDSSEDEDEKLDLSSANKITDDELVRACGGRTAHKGARHGLTMSAKLARLEEQEREFLAKYGKKDQKSVPSEKPPSKVSEEALCSEGSKKKKKSKKSKSQMNACPLDIPEADAAVDVHSPNLKKKRKRKTHSFSEEIEQTNTEIRHPLEEPMEEEYNAAELQVADQVKSKKRKKKEKKEKLRDLSEDCEEIIVKKCKKKKKKKKLQEDSN